LYTPAELEVFDLKDFSEFAFLGGFENGLNIELIQYPANTVRCFFYVWENGKGSFTRLIL